MLIGTLGEPLTSKLSATPMSSPWIDIGIGTSSSGGSGMSMSIRVSNSCPGDESSSLLPCFAQVCGICVGTEEERIFDDGGAAGIAAGFGWGDYEARG